jgi:hypothetical protein
MSRRQISNCHLTMSSMELDSGNTGFGLDLTAGDTGATTGVGGSHEIEVGVVLTGVTGTWETEIGVEEKEAETGTRGFFETKDFLDSCLRDEDSRTRFQRINSLFQITHHAKVQFICKLTNTMINSFFKFIHLGLYLLCNLLCNCFHHQFIYIKGSIHFLEKETNVKLFHKARILDRDFSWKYFCANT